MLSARLPVYEATRTGVMVSTWAVWSLNPDFNDHEGKALQIRSSSTKTLEYVSSSTATLLWVLYMNAP